MVLNITINTGRYLDPVFQIVLQILLRHIYSIQTSHETRLFTQAVKRLTSNYYNLIKVYYIGWDENEMYTSQTHRPLDLKYDTLTTLPPHNLPLKMADTDICKHI